MAQLGGNEVEFRAIAWVLKLEIAEGRSPTDTHRTAGAPTDIDSPPRLIEVKAFSKSARLESVFLEVSQVLEARSNPDFYLYIVEKVASGDEDEFTLKVFSGDALQRLLLKAKEHLYHAIYLSAGEYDAAPSTVS